MKYLVCCRHLSIGTVVCSSQKSHYTVLDIPSKASKSDVKEAYLRKSKELHPDKNSSPAAKEEFLEVQNAYDTLSNIHLRRQYDDKMLHHNQKNTSQRPMQTNEEIWRPTHYKRKQDQTETDPFDMEHPRWSPKYDWYDPKDPLHPESERFKKFEEQISSGKYRSRLLTLIFILSSTVYFGLTEP